MRVKPRTLNELRQTKDSHYVAPQTEYETTIQRVFEEYFHYIKSMSGKNETSLSSFKNYLSENKFRIVKGS